ncbi:MAG: hypothetical protein SFY69_02630 [Planctomycetota bacterium]|nr:hypothetical protein [Planctomycetota bacterium]
MFNKIRDLLDKAPWLGWVFAAVLLAVSVVIYQRGQGGTDPYSPERMRETVTIRFTDTEDEIEMTRGQMDKELRQRGASLNPNEGIINPKTGKPTGFLFNKAEWEQMITRINAEKAAVRSAAAGRESAKKPSVAPRQEVSPEEAAKLLEAAKQQEKK